jgi:hypothetical protein
MTCLMHLGRFSASTRYCLPCIRLSQKQSALRSLYTKGRAGSSRVDSAQWGAGCGKFYRSADPECIATCTLALWMQLAHSCFSSLKLLEGNVTNVFLIKALKARWLQSKEKISFFLVQTGFLIYVCFFNILTLTSIKKKLHKVVLIYNAFSFISLPEVLWEFCICWCNEKGISLLKVIITVSILTHSSRKVIWTILLRLAGVFCYWNERVCVYCWATPIRYIIRFWNHGASDQDTHKPHNYYFKRAISLLSVGDYLKPESDFLTAVT